jgi:hypothetical protein
MAEPIHHEPLSPMPKLPFGLHNLILWLFGAKFLLYAYDYVMMRFTLSKRHRQLAHDQLTCRFCSSDIDLMGMWKCSCGHTHPGNYYGRCPKCLGHPEYIDCPACRATMDVR